MKTVTIPALGKDITNPKYKIKVSGLDPQKYTGSTITLKNLKVTSGRTVLRKGTDYTVTWHCNGYNKWYRKIQRNYHRDIPDQDSKKFCICSKAARN